MRILELDRLANFDLFAIYRRETERNPRLADPSLGSRVSVDLSLGNHFHRLLTSRLIDELSAGHRLIDLRLHPQLSRLIASWSLNRTWMEQGGVTHLPASSHEDLPVCEVNCHALPGMAGTGDGPADAGRCLDLLMDEISARLATGHHRFSILATARLIALIQRHGETLRPE